MLLPCARVQPFEAFVEFPDRRIQHRRQRRGVVPALQVALVFGELREHRGQQFFLEADDVFGGIDETELEVERVVLGQMPRTRVGFRAIHVTRLEHAFERGDPVLFVELRALRQIRDTVEVVDREQVRAAFGAGRDDLRRDDLGEAVLASGIRGSNAATRPACGTRRRSCRCAPRAGGIPAAHRDPRPEMSLDELNGSLFVAGFSTRTCAMSISKPRFARAVGARRTDHLDGVVELQMQRVRGTRNRADALHFAAASRRITNVVLASTRRRKIQPRSTTVSPRCCAVERTGRVRD